jgi:hypothetical protein
MRFIVRSDITDYLEAVTRDDALLQMRVKGLIPNTVFLWKLPPFTYLLKQASALYIDRVYSESVGYPVTRSATLNGRPTSVVVTGGAWNIITVADGLADQYQRFGYGVWEYVSGKNGLVLENKGNDLVVAGTDRKVSGLGASMEGSIVFDNCFFANESPTVDMSKILLPPPSKFEGKEVTTVTERASSFAKETGSPMDAKTIESDVREYFASIGIALEDSDFTAEETTFAESLRAKHQSEDWIKYGTYGNYPDFQ